MELNPNNENLRIARDKWHKIAAMIMHKLGADCVVIRQADVDDFVNRKPNIVLDARDESKTGEFRILLVDDKAAAELVRREGGRPQDC